MDGYSTVTGGVDAAAAPDVPMADASTVATDDADEGPRALVPLEQGALHAAAGGQASSSADPWSTATVPMEEGKDGHQEPAVGMNTGESKENATDQLTVVAKRKAPSLRSVGTSRFKSMAWQRRPFLKLNCKILGEMVDDIGGAGCSYGFLAEGVPATAELFGRDGRGAVAFRLRCSAFADDHITVWTSFDCTWIKKLELPATERERFGDGAAASVFDVREYRTYCDALTEEYFKKGMHIRSKDMPKFFKWILLFESTDALNGLIDAAIAAIGETPDARPSLGGVQSAAGRMCGSGTWGGGARRARYELP